MAVPIQNLRSGTATKRPVASGLAFGQVAVNYNEADPAVYLRGDANALIKVSPVFVGSTAPNATPASGGSAGNSKGEQWLDTASSPPTPKVWNGSAFVSSYTFTSGTTLIQPLVTSGTISGSTIINATISGTFTLPSGVITSDAIANDSIVNADINSAAAIVDTKLATISTSNKVGIAAIDIDGGTDIGAALADADLFIVDDGGAGTNRKAAASRITDYAFNKISGDVTIASNGAATIAELAVNKLANGTARQLLQTAANGTDVEFTSNVSVPGTLALTGVGTFAAATRGTVSASGTVSGTVTLDFAAANNFSMTLSAGAVTLANPTNLTAGQSGAITITQDASTARTLSYGGYFKFESGTPTITTTLGALSTLFYYVDSTTRITAKLITNPTGA